MFQKLTIIGYVGQEPNFGTTKSGSPVLNMLVATNERRRDSQTGEAIQETEWHDIVMFGSLGRGRS